jgi:hypothetical protein
MGVQFYGVTESSRSDAAHFSMNGGGGGGGQREADLVLEPTKEALDFTLRLLAANRMAKVVQILCHFESANNNSDSNRTKTKTWKLTQQDITNLFQAIGGIMNDNDNDSDDDENVVTEEYQPSSSNNNLSYYSGMPHLESLSIACQHATEETPSFLEGLTQLISSSRSSSPRFTRLSLEGVNLRGSALEVHGLAETVRLHPRLYHWQMQSCYFTSEQQSHVHVLEQAMQQKGSAINNNNNNNNSSSAIRTTTTVPNPTDAQESASASAGLRQRKDVSQQVSNNSNLYSQQQDDSHQDKEVDSFSSWWSKLWKSCFCSW